MSVQAPTRINRPVRDAQAGGEKVVRSRGFEWLARSGFVARGLIYGIIGILAINAKKPEEAVPAFDRAIAIKPDLPDAYYYRGLARMQLKRNAEAKADFQKALELAPDGPDAKDIRDLLKTMP